MRFGEQCPALHTCSKCGNQEPCGHQELKNWRPAFGPRGLISDVIEHAEVPEIVGSHRIKDTWIDGFWAYHLTKRWLKRMPTAVYKANGGWYGDSRILIGTDRPHVEAKRELMRKFGRRTHEHSQTKLIEVMRNEC